MAAHEHETLGNDITGFLGRVFTRVAGKLGIDPAGWDLSRVVSDGGTYKVEWVSAEDEAGDQHEVTLYDNGEAAHDGGAECGVWPLHDRRWVPALGKDGFPGAYAGGAVDFFKRLKAGG
jgi:hypothetical protein